MKRLEFFSRKRSIQNILKIFGLSLVVMLASCEDDDNNNGPIDNWSFLKNPLKRDKTYISLGN